MFQRFRLNFDAILDDDTTALNDGTITFYVSQTTTLAPIYNDAHGTLPKTNPVVLDVDGRHGDIFTKQIAYRIVVKDRHGAVVPRGDIDPYLGPGGEIGASSTLSEAQALYPAVVTLTDGHTMIVSGRTTAYDGYQGSFVYKAGDTTTTFPGNGLGFVDSAGRRWFRIIDDVINVRWFNAKGDGTTDDATAVQSAATAAAGATLYFPTGQYRIATNVNLSGIGALKGDGTASVLIGATGASSQFLSATNTDGLTLRDVKLVHNGSSVTLTTCNRLRIRNLYCSGTTTLSSKLTAQGIWFKGCKDVVVEGCSFDDFNDAIYFDKSGTTNSSGVKVLGCHFQHLAHGNFFSYPAQIYQYNCDDLIVDSCSFLNIFPGGADPSPVGYCVYEGDGVATSTQVSNCIYRTTEASTLTAFVFTSTGRTAIVSDNIMDCQNASGGGFLYRGTVVSYGLSITGNSSNRGTILACEAGVSGAVTITDNILWYSGGFNAIRIGANAATCTAGNISRNQVRFAVHGGIFADGQARFNNICDNIIEAANTNNNAYAAGNEFMSTCICIYDNAKGIVSRNFCSNAPGGHAKYGIVSQLGGPTIDTDNTYTSMETGNTTTL